MQATIFLVLAAIIHRISGLRIRQAPTSTQLTATFPSPSAASGPKDPCGPQVQDRLDPTIPNDTCTANITFSPVPATYGATLLNDGSGLYINYENCYPVVLDVCAALTSPLTPHGVWNWTGVGSECTMGFWLPIYPGAAPLKTVSACENEIYRPMVNIGEQMGGTAYNQVVVNLVNLPDDSQNGTQVSAGYPSYTITYLPLQNGNESSTPA